MSHVDSQVNMVSAVTEAVKIKKENPGMDNERIMQKISRMAENVRGEQAKLGMVVAASKTLQIMDREKGLKDKDIIKMVVAEFPNMLGTINKRSG